MAHKSKHLFLAQVIHLQLWESCGCPDSVWLCVAQFHVSLPVPLWDTVYRAVRQEQQNWRRQLMSPGSAQMRQTSVSPHRPLAKASLIAKPEGREMCNDHREDSNEWRSIILSQGKRRGLLQTIIPPTTCCCLLLIWKSLALIHIDKVKNYAGLSG